MLTGTSRYDTIKVENGLKGGEDNKFLTNNLMGYKTGELRFNFSKNRSYYI